MNVPELKDQLVFVKISGRNFSQVFYFEPFISLAAAV